MILVVILYAVFAVMTFINTFLMASDPYPILVGMFRALGSGLIIVGYMSLFGNYRLADIKLTTYQWYLLIAYGILIHALGMCGFSYGAMYASPITICFLYASAPFLTAIILYFYEGTLLTKTKAVGLIIGLIGLLPILWKSTTSDVEFAISDKQWLGNIIILVSMIFFCWGWILFKKLIHSSSHSVQMLNGIAMIIGGILSAVIVGIKHGQAFLQLPFSDNFGMLLSLFVLSSFLTYTLYAYLLQYYSPTFISFAGFLEPAFALLYGFLLFGYSIQIVEIISFIILFFGLYIFYKQELVENI